MSHTGKTAPPVRLSVADIRLRQMIAHIPDIFEFKTLLYIGARTDRFLFGADFAQHGYHITVVEVFKENVDFLTRNVDFVQDVAHLDIRHLSQDELRKRKFDVVMWYHGPEHVLSGELLSLLPLLEDMTNRHLVLACPWGEYPQDALYGNPYEVHQHAYYPQFFSKLHFQVDTLGREDVPGSNILAWKTLWNGQWFIPPTTPTLRPIPHQHTENPYFYYYHINQYAGQEEFVKLEKWIKRFCHQFDLPPHDITDHACSFYANEERDIKKVFKFYHYFYHQKMLGPGGVFRLAVTNRLAGKYNEAQTCFQQLIDQPHAQTLKQSAHYELGIVYLFREQFQRAVDNFNLALAPDLAQTIPLYRIYFRMAQAHYRLNRHDEARQYLTQCLQQCPNHNDAQSLLQSLHSI